MKFSETNRSLFPFLVDKKFSGNWRENDFFSFHDTLTVHGIAKASKLLKGKVCPRKK